MRHLLWALLPVVGCDDGGKSASDAALEVRLNDAQPADAPPADAQPAEPEVPASVDTLRCQLASADRPATRFPEPFGVEIVPVYAGQTLPEGLLLRWRLDEQPEGSEGTLMDPAAPTFEFTPDVPGIYRFCYLAATVDAQGTGCCRISAIEQLAAREEPEALEVTREWLLLVGGLHLRWRINQPVAVDLPGAVIVAPEAWGPGRLEYTGFATSDESVEVRPRYTVHFPAFEPRAGDRVEVAIPILPRVTPTPDAWLRGAVQIVVPADLEVRGPELLEAELRPAGEGWVLRARIEAEVENDYLLGRLQGARWPEFIRFEREGRGPWWVAEFEEHDPPAGPTHAAVLDVTDDVPYLEESTRVRADPRFWSPVVEVRVIEP